MISAVPDIHEPFDAAFTGQLTTFVSQETKLRYSFKAPYPRIVKGQAYMMVHNPVTKSIRLVPVVKP